jgi:hypothetical protein
MTVISPTTNQTPAEPAATPQAQSAPTPQAQAQTPAGQEPAAVPYERFKEVNEKYKSLETKLQEIEKSQKAADEARLKEQGDYKKLYEDLQAQLNTEKVTNMKLKQASSKGLPIDLVNRVQGNTEEEIAQDIDNLISFMKKETPATGGVNPPPKGGSSTGAFDFANATPQQVREHLAKQNQQ